MNDSDNQNILEILQYLKNTQICKNCAENNEKLHEKNINIFQNSQESSKSYNNTVISLCYVALLIVFSATYNRMPQNIVNAFSINLLTSILFFYINEVHKNSIDRKINEKLYETVSKDNSKYYEALINWFTNRSDKYNNFKKYWFIYYQISFISGSAAAALLFGGLFYCHT